MSSLDGVWWVKYRPETLNDLCISDKNREIINSFGKDIPNLMFVGRTGVGKTTLAKILVLDVLKCDFLYINASEENGIDTIRTKISGFVQTKSFDGGLKVVILDEADGLTMSSQQALRNIMESYADNARFILTGNNKYKISSALQSRCQELDIKPSLSQAFKRCLHILNVEGVETTQEQKKQLAILVKSHFPDLRKCINEMQKYVIGNELIITQKVNNNEICAKIFSHIESKDTLNLRKYLIQNDELFNSDWDQLLSDLLNYIYDLSYQDSKKKAMILTIADHLEKSSRVNDKEINFFACVLNLEQL
jgi:DNA polymerase III delta prime subunit